MAAGYLGIDWANFDWGEHARQLGAIMGTGGAAKPQYQSKYQNTLDALLDKIVNRGDFSYDFNADPLYQQYKDQYTKLGNEASMNAVANTAAMTGGFGNSYGVTAASQANQQYLTQLNDKIPQLQQAALNMWQMQGQELMNKYGAVGDAEDRAYSRYRDDVSDYYNDRNFNYQVGRDNLSDSQWQKQFEHQQERDKVADTQWLASYLKSAKSGGSKRSGSSKSGTTNATTISKSGTAATKTGGSVDRSAETLDVPKRSAWIAKIENSSNPTAVLQNAYDNGEISKGDWDYLKQLYDKKNS